MIHSMNVAIIAFLSPSLVFCAKTTTSSTASSKTSTSTTTTSSNPCPAAYTGRVATAGCAGYADCINGKLSVSYPCTAGTLYDAKTGICNWPSSVTCTATPEEDPVDDDDYTDDKEKVVEGDGIFAKFCPTGYTGKAPTTDCLGYVVCTDGKEGLSSKCPADSIFNSMTLRCEYGFNDCQLLVNQEKLLNFADFAKYCPDEYTGKAPTENCGGYVKCNKGKVEDALRCPTGTKFDVMKLACTYADVVCEGPKKDEMEQQSQQVAASAYCRDDYTGRAPTKDCKGFVDCVKGVAKNEKTCPSGTLFDVMILACTYSEVNCEATVVAEVPPTSSPVEEKHEKERPDRIVVSEECPAGFTGNKAINGCTGYIYCSNGSQIGKFDCTSGTVFDAKLGYCNWPQNVNTDVPECQTSSPSFFPTLSPMYPTFSPSYSPTILDLGGELYYPDYKNGICKNDGKYPTTLSNIYLRSNAHGCCSTFFEQSYDRCMLAFISEAPSVSPSHERTWYPDYDYNMCRSDEEYGQYEVNFFASYERCCKFEFLDEMECLTKKPSAMGLIYYPHYPSGTCKNDGRQSSDELYLYTSKKDCCKNDQVQPYDSCMEAKNDVGTGTKDYYPDYDRNICLNDGKAPENEVNFFSSYDACCEFTWIDTEKCLANKPIPDSEKWYPVEGSGYCLNNGNPPDKVALSNTAKDCCAKFYSSSQKSCVNKSTKRWYPDYNPPGFCKNDGNEPQGVLMSETYMICCDHFMPANKAQCYSDSSGFMTTLSAQLTNNPTANPTAEPTKMPTSKPTKMPTSKPTKMPTSKPTKMPTSKPIQAINADACRLNNEKQCKKDSSCKWNGTVCTSLTVITGAPISSAPTSEPTKSPTDQPTNEPSTKPSRSPSNQSIINELSCQSMNKKRCKLNDLCQWDDSTAICSSAMTEQSVQLTQNPTLNPTSEPTTEPTPVPTPMPTFASWTKLPTENPTTAPTTSPSLRPTNQSITNDSTCGLSTKKRQCQSNGFCRWDDASQVCSSASVLVESTPEPTSGPTSAPTSQPTKLPTASPSLRPSNSICVTLRKKKQCEANDSCLWDDSTAICSSASPPTQSPSSVEEKWYPVIAQSRCVILPSTKPNTDPYSTYEDCCNNPWINNKDGCIEDAKTQIGSGSESNDNPYYPDYFRGSCQNDGKEPKSEISLYVDLESCCRNPWLDYSRCKMIAAAESLPSNGLKPYYPDYFFNMCRNDGNQPKSETYLFDNVEDCCGLEYMDYEGCIYLSK